MSSKKSNKNRNHNNKNNNKNNNIKNVSNNINAKTSEKLDNNKTNQVKKSVNNSNQKGQNNNKVKKINNQNSNPKPKVQNASVNSNNNKQNHLQNKKKNNNSNKKNNNTNKKIQNINTNKEEKKNNSVNSSTNENKKTEELENKKIKKENVVNIKNEVKEEVKEEPKEQKQTSKSTKAILIILITIIIIFLSFVMFFFLNFMGRKINSKIYIDDIEVSNLTRQEAREKIENEYENVTNNTLKLKYNDKEYSINLNEIEFRLLIDDSVNRAMDIGRDNNIIYAVKDFYLLKFGNPRSLDLKFDYNKDKLYSKIAESEKDFYKEVKQYSYVLEDDKLKIKRGEPGIKVNYEQLELEFAKAIESKSLETVIEIPITVEEPEEINTTKIHNEVFVEMQNASYTLNPFEIHNEVRGVNFDLRALNEMIANEPLKTDYEIGLIYTEPTTRVENLDLYNDELGSCSTGYVNNPNRTMNLRLAASKVDGMILMPGETFSYNDVVGERTYSAGYRNAAIFVNGEVEDGLGGGICQISSTIYNAVVKANLEVVERYNHARVPSYLPAGKDATVYWGSKDFKFKNNRDYPIRINVDVVGGYATAKIYGTSTENEYDISIETAVVSRYNGYLVVNSYKVYRQNGEVVNREFIAQDSYKIG